MAKAVVWIPLSKEKLAEEIYRNHIHPHPTPIPYT